MKKMLRRFLVGLAFLIIALPVLFAGYIFLQTHRGMYAFEKEPNTYFYTNGCPYTLGAATCRWTSHGYSGFRIGMSREEMLATMCSGNEHGKYVPPLMADKKPNFEADSRVSFWEPQDFPEFPCGDPDRLNGLIRFTFEREARAWELGLHREIFGLVFEGNELILIQVHRSLFWIDL